ncbi:MAG: BrnA antitoxin family protein [Rickettsiales bacterium]|jgi:uncharacterized protein (DUF4415 family)|nr:BrnA antitoxin family protein [Rickettsiales bacterium]
MKKKEKSTKSSWIDPDDAPELTREWFEKADLYIGDTLIRRGRPKKPVTAKTVAIRLDPEVEKRFRAMGKGWQTEINKVLKNWVKRHPA